MILLLQYTLIFASVLLLVALGGVLDWLVTYAKAALAAKILAAKNALG